MARTLSAEELQAWKTNIAMLPQEQRDIILEGLRTTGLHLEPVTGQATAQQNAHLRVVNGSYTYALIHPIIDELASKAVLKGAKKVANGAVASAPYVAEGAKKVANGAIASAPLIAKGAIKVAIASAPYIAKGAQVVAKGAIASAPYIAKGVSNLAVSTFKLLILDFTFGIVRFFAKHKLQEIGDGMQSVAKGLGYLGIASTLIFLMIKYYCSVTGVDVQTEFMKESVEAFPETQKYHVSLPESTPEVMIALTTTAIVVQCAKIYLDYRSKNKTESQKAREFIENAQLSAGEQPDAEKMVTFERVVVQPKSAPPAKPVAYTAQAIAYQAKNPKPKPLMTERARQILLALNAELEE